MKRIFKHKFILLIILGVGVFLGCFYFCVNNKKIYTEIDNVLESENYAYLPIEAKDYIKKVYEESGEILLTEKNKEINKPYLNPLYVDYLTLSEEEKSEVGLIPSNFKINSIYDLDAAIEDEVELPITYDLRNVNGKNYLTPMKNQYPFGLCWAFASIENVETYLMYKDKKGYDESSDVLSVRQLDYAASDNGIKNYSNPNGYRNLGYGGNFYFAGTIMMRGLALTSEDYMPYNSLTTQKELYEVFNYNNSLYEVNSSVQFSDADHYVFFDKKIYNLLNEALSHGDKEEQQKWSEEHPEYEALYYEIYDKYLETYVNKVNANIMNYGGAYIGTYAPGYSCGTYDKNGNYFVSIDGGCAQSQINTGHAMQIIGWDDDYEYSYCKLSNKHTGTLDDNTCAKGNLVSGKGAWILRNSWGESSDYDYFYLTYDSIFAGYYAPDVNLVSSVTSISDRTWDNTYYSSDGLTDTSINNDTLSTHIDNYEKLEKVKFYALAEGGKYNLTIKIGDTEYNNFEEIVANNAGIITVDISDKNIYVDDDDIEINIVSNSDNVVLTYVDEENQTYDIETTNYFCLLAGSLTLFTSNVDDEPIIYLDDVVSGKMVTVYSDTRNIDSGETINYYLFDGSNDVSEYMTVSNNIVAVNNINTNLIFDYKNLGNKEYTLKAEYNGYTFSSNLNFNSTPTIELIDMNINKLSNTNISFNSNNVMDGDVINYYLYDGNTDVSEYMIVTNNVVKDNIANVKFTFDYDNLENKEYTLKAVYDGYEFESTIVFDTTITIELTDINVNSLLDIERMFNTHNIMDGDVINYYLYDGNTDVSEYMTIINNTVSNSVAKTKFSFDLINLENKEYTLKAVYDGYEFESTITFDIYFISTEEELRNINDNLDGVYFLVNDITLTEEWIPIGTEDNPFKGSFDGLGHTIKNLEITDNTLKYGGLFGYVMVGEGSAFRNISFKNINIDISGDIINHCGALIGFIDKDSDVLESKVSINNVYVIGGSIKGYSVGALLSSSSSGVVFDIDSVFNSASLNGSITGIVPTLQGTDAGKISNVENIGSISSEVNTTNESRMMATTLINLSPLEVNNFLVTSIVKYPYKLNNNLYLVAFRGEEFLGSNFNNGFYYDLVSDNVGLKVNNIYTFNSSLTLKDASIYSSFGDDFSEKWEMKSIDGITRIPMLKGVDVEYTDVDTIVVLEDESVSLLDFITPSTDAVRINYTTLENEDLISITDVYDTDVLYPKDILIEGKEIGETTIHLISDYDGYENDVNVKVVSSNAPKVKFYANLNDDVVPIIQEYTLGESFELRENTFTRDDYVFVGWNTKSDGSGISYSDCQNVNFDGFVHLYAMWVKNSYNVTFNSNGGIGAMNSVSFDYNTEKALPKNLFTREGYRFVSWNTESDGSGESYSDEELISIDNDMTLYAIWNANEYYIFWYDANLEYNKMTTHLYDVEYVLSGYKWEFIKRGYSFLKWNTKSDGSGINYLEGDTFSNLSSTHKDVINLYSILRANNYIIKYNSNDTNISNSISDSSCVYDSNCKLNKNIFIKSGYTFIGWNTESDGSGESYSDEEVVRNLSDIDGDIITLYAQWRVNSIVNNTTDKEFIYDGREHTIDIDIEDEEYNIKYSLDNINFNLDTIPKFKDVGEHTVYYKITKDGYNDYTGFNKVKIYGIKGFDNSVTLKNNILVVSNKSFTNLKNKINIYAIQKSFTHLDNNNNVKTVDNIKTGDKIKININETKDFSYNISYLGDVNGDGVIGIIDYIRIMKDIMGTNRLSGVYLEAADMNRNNSIDIIDYIRVMKVIME